MKYRVIGWTHYDDVGFEDESCSESALQAIIEDIRKNGYLFSGYDHQETFDCAPVLNDGKRRCFSQRGFGGVMAKAHGDYSRMGYSAYAFDWYTGDGKDDDRVFPKNDINFATFVPETDLNEELSTVVTQDEFDRAKNGSLTILDRDELKFIDAGDTLTLKCADQTASYLVKGFERRKDISHEMEIEIMTLSYSFDEPEKMKKANKMYEDAPWVLDFKF
jgi:hypothetical protein